MFKKEAEFSPYGSSLKLVPWFQYLTLLLPPPVVVAFEAKWCVNKSNIPRIVWHPKGPTEVTLVVQITWGHSVLAFLALFPRGSTFLIPRKLPSTHCCHHTDLFTFGHLSFIKWAPFLDSTCTGLLSVKTRDHPGPYIHFLQSHRHLTLAVSEKGSCSLIYVIYQL